MSEPMVRVLDVICGRHGSSDASSHGYFPVVVEKKKVIEPRYLGCEFCHKEGYERPHPLRFGTEPVDLEPREEQSG